MTTTTVTPPSQPQPASPRMTAEEFALQHAGDHVEYVDGQVKEIPMAGGRHGKICFKIAFVLGQFIETHHLGHVFINDTFVKVPTPNDPERVYGPDVCFVAYDRLAKDAEVPAGVLSATPNLVFEVRSPSDTWTTAIGKVVDYLNAGVSAVVLLDPDTRTASVCGKDFWQRTFHATDTLTIPEVLPGFAVPVAKLFE